MAKSPDAFRTISEVADWLGIQAHVLRFWESKFTQVKPIKRAGGRRYYRPADMLLLGGIKRLLHEDGLTIKGVQKILREEGMSHVADMSEPLDELTMSQLDDAAPIAPKKPATAVVTPEEEKGVVLSFEGGSASKPDTTDAQETDSKDETLAKQADVSSETVAPEVDASPVVEPSDEPAQNVAPEVSEAPTKFAEENVAKAEVTDSAPDAQKSEPAPTEEVAASEPEAPVAPAPEPAAQETSQPDIAATEETSHDPGPATQEDVPEPAEEPVTEAEQPAPAAALPAFLRRPLVEPETSDAKPETPAEVDAEETAAEQAAPTPEPIPEPAPAAPKPRIIDLPAFTPEAEFPAAPAVLSAAFRTRKIKAEHKAKTSTLLKQLTALRDSMAARRRAATPPPAKD